MYDNWTVYFQNFQSLLNAMIINNKVLVISYSVQPHGSNGSIIFFFSRLEKINRYGNASPVIYP